jgi:azurin
MKPKHTLLTLASLALLGGMSLSAQAADKVCKLEISGNDMMQYDKKVLKVEKDCTQVELTLKHSGKMPVTAMGHNWVLTKSGDAGAVASAGLSAGPSNNYVDPADKRVIAHTKLVGGGESTSVTFPMSALKAGESYTYECTFPGHNGIMSGKLVVG